ncbi:MAG: tetratricopeptide repeat protein, partial [Desulfuromonadaceae bacterium]|nr:tetratricopeptide repeat protein [Desulfuromonadaceae bacterium]
AILQQGLSKLPKSAALHYGFGVLLDADGQAEEAAAAMRKAIELNGQHVEALNYLAYSFAEQGIHLEEALEFAQRALAINNAGHIFDTLGWVYFKLGRFTEARPELEAAATLLAEDAVVQEHLADVYRALQLYERARRTYHKALQIKPDDPALESKLKALPHD